MMDIANILQTLTIAVLIWVGNRIVTVSEKTAVHEEKLSAHHERINKLEEKPACPHINRA